MKLKIGMAVGLPSGIALYHASVHGVQEIDWVRVAAVPVIALVLLWFVPNRWFGKKKSDS